MNFLIFVGSNRAVSMTSASGMSTTAIPSPGYVDGVAYLMSDVDFYPRLSGHIMSMVFAAVVGFVFWGEVPVLTTWIGAAIIAASGIFIFARRQKRLQNTDPVEPAVIE